MPIYVIQEHDTFRDKAKAKPRKHWDLRLEVPAHWDDLAKYNGKRAAASGEPFPVETPETVLRSFAVPKCRLPAKGEKLMAIPTENHPLQYADFQGTIPDGHYGAGEVRIVARGEYSEEGGVVTLDPGYTDKGSAQFRIVEMRDGNCLLVGLFKK